MFIFHVDSKRDTIEVEANTLARECQNQFPCSHKSQTQDYQSQDNKSSCSNCSNAVLSSGCEPPKTVLIFLADSGKFQKESEFWKNT